MRVYLDDDMDVNMLTRPLQDEGHEGISPRTVGMRGAGMKRFSVMCCPPVCCVTANARDFLTLHQAWQEAGRHHAGILALYRENNPQRDMTYVQIARAISRLARARLALQNTFHNLNMWRESSHR